MKTYKEYWQDAMSYSYYKNLLESLLAEGKTTGENQSEEMLAYAKLNFQRMKRVEKTFKPTDELKSALKDLNQPLKWLVLTEGWCGDAAQLVSAMDKIASLSDKLEIRFLLRDQNLELMDQFLTRGGRAIPLLIFLDSNFEVAGRWGARPAELQQMIDEMKEDKSMTFPKMVEEVHKWYANDKSQSVQAELTEMLEQHNAKA